MQVMTATPSEAMAVVVSEPKLLLEVVTTLKRLLIPSAALLWGLQFAFLNPALALLLVRSSTPTLPRSVGCWLSTTAVGS
jgi:hypothetical protein